MNHGNLDQAEDEEEEEEVDAIPAHSFSTAKFKKLWPDMKEEDVALKVTKILNKPLGVKSQVTGCVYIISPQDTDEFKGMLKVGFSNKHPKHSRFKAHKHCFGSFNVIQVRSVTCAYRVEQLLFAEFSPVRYGMKCQRQNCPDTHQEWLKIDEETILESLNKWCRFFDESVPYRLDGQLDTLPEEGPALPTPVLRPHLRPARSTRSSPQTTPSKKDKKKKILPGETPIRKARAGTPTETPTKTFQHQSSPHASPSHSGPKIPKITATALPDSDGEDLATQESDMGPEEATVGWLAATIRRLVFT
jgi:hypothetical protein